MFLRFSRSGEISNSINQKNGYEYTEIDGGRVCVRV